MLSEKPWRFEAVLFFWAVQISCWCFGVQIAAVLQKFGVAGFEQTKGFGMVVVGTLSFQGAAWLLIYFFLRHHRIGWREGFGFSHPQLGRALAIAGFTVLIILPIAWGLEWASAHFLDKIGWNPELQKAVQTLVDEKSWWARAYLGFFTIVCAPVAEEFMFRGMLYPFIKQLGYPRLAWFGVSFLFAAIHLNLAILIPLFVLALALTWLYEETDNLLAPIAAHSLFNAANFLALILQT
jgi:membrane protease YdiL (CAAX protease family)